MRHIDINVGVVILAMEHISDHTKPHPLVLLGVVTSRNKDRTLNQSLLILICNIFLWSFLWSKVKQT